MAAFVSFSSTWHPTRFHGRTNRQHGIRKFPISYNSLANSYGAQVLEEFWTYIPPQKSGCVKLALIDPLEVGSVLSNSSETILQPKLDVFTTKLIQGAPPLLLMTRIEFCDFLNKRGEYPPLERADRNRALFMNGK